MSDHEFSEDDFHNDDDDVVDDDDDEINEVVDVYNSLTMLTDEVDDGAGDDDDIVDVGDDDDSKDITITTSRLTKYEKTRLIGMRAQMIANGCPSTVDYDDDMSPIQIAELELKERKIPLIIRRHMYFNKAEEVNPNNLIF